MRPALRRPFRPQAQAEGNSNPEPEPEDEHYCTACRAYHPLSAFSPNVLRHRVYKCRASAVALNRQYRQRLSAKLKPEERRSRNVLRTVRRLGRFKCGSRRLELCDVERALAMATGMAEVCPGCHCGRVTVARETMDAVVRALEGMLGDSNVNVEA
jgi:hypothetical protein